MRLLKKIGLWFLAMAVLMIGLAYTLFFFNQEVIKNEILLGVNKDIQGRLQIDKIGLNLFSEFPKITISLENARLYEYKGTSGGTTQMPILVLAQARVSINVKDLINNKLSIQKLVLDGGSVALMYKADSTFNILNAIRTTNEDTTLSEDNVSLHLNNIEISNMHIEYHDMATNRFVVTTINSLESSIMIMGDSLIGEIILDQQLDSITANGVRIMNEHALSLSASFEADINNIAFNINQGKIKVDLLEADLDGYYDYSDNGYVDVNISANHSDLSMLAEMEVLNADYLPEIRSGKIKLDAVVKGKTIGYVPVMNLEASLSELHLHNKFGDVIDDSGFHLRYYSGTQSDMSDAILYIDSIDFKFATDGYMTGDLQIYNFANPSYKISWQLAENLVDLNNIFVFPGLNEMSGMVRSQARLKGKVNLTDKQFSNPEGILRVQFENCLFSLNNPDYLLKDVNGQLFIEEGELSLNNLTFDANGNELKVSSKITNLLPYLTGTPTELIADLSLHTHSLNTYHLLAFNRELQAKANYKIDSVDLVAKANFLSTDIDSFTVIPTGNLAISNLTAKVSGLPLINQVKGDIIIKPNTLILEQLTGFVGKSPVSLNLNMLNYDGFFQTDSLETMVLNLDLRSEKLIAKDFFTANGKFILPKSYEEEVLKNVAFSTSITTNNYELQKTGLLPEFSFQVTGLNFQTHFSPVKFKDIGVFGVIRNNNIYINSLFGKLGRSDVFMNAEFNNALATTDTISRPFKSRISINSNLLDLDELVKLGVTDSDHLSAEPDKSTENPFADDYPITDLNVNIGRLEYYGAEINNLSGMIDMEDHNIIKLHHLRLESGEYGSFEFEGVLDASSHQEAILTSNIKISDVDLSKLDITYVQDAQEVKIGDHLAGIFNGEIEASVPIFQDFSFDLARLSGSVKAVVKNGALLNYTPLQELGKYFKNKDLNNVYFADLMNTMIFDQGKMHLPFMTISTTLGTIFLMGYQTIDGDMEFDVQVPAKMVAGAVLNSLFAANKNDDGKQDEIITGAKGKYITVHVYGNTDEYKFKIGKKHGTEPVAEVME
jgi:AsmA family/AsmA-like C-terminal region